MTQRRARKQPSEAHDILNARGAERTDALEKANEDLKAAQAELQRRWQYLAEAQRLSHSGTFGWKVDSGELLWSDETYRILGFTRETNPTLDLVFDRIHPDDRERLRRLRDLATKDGMDLDDEHRLQMPDGVIKYVHVVAHAGSDSSGNREYIGVVSDITERKRAEDERQALSRDLQESNARLEEAQRVAHVGYWEWDLATGEVIWSDETYRIFGLRPQERPMDLGTVRGMVHPEDREALYGGVDVEIDAGVHPVADFRIVTPSGEVRTVHAITSKLWGVMPGDPDDEASGKARRLFGTVQDITERKRAEEELQVLYRELQESKASLDEGQRVAHVGSWVWDLEKNHVTYSDEYYRIFGLAPEKGPIDIATVREMIHPEDRDYVFRTAEEAIRSGERAECEHRILRPSGEIRIVHSLGDLKKDASGRPYQMFGVSQDITDRKRAEQALQRSQFYLSEGERLAHMGSWASRELGIRWSDDLNIYWSDEVYRIYGLDPKNGTPNLEQYLATVHPLDRASMAETLKTMHEQRCGCDVTTRIVRPDGEIRYVRCVGIPVVEGGVFQGFHGTTMDVTEQELLTRELRREQAYLAEAQSFTHAGSWACNLLTREIFHSSDENARLYGFDPSQGPIPFNLYYNAILPEDERIIRGKLENAIHAGADYEVEFRIRRPDGTIGFLHGIGHHNPSQEVGEYFGITIDITDRKRAEEERERLRRLEADLAHINRVNMMGELAAALAHEIKQPIAASITSANALLRWLAHDPPDLERARAAAARIEQDGNRAAGVIDSLQSFYRTGTPVERHIVDVKEIIGEMTVLLRVEADRHSIEIHPELEADTPKTLANRVQLQQVFMNLMLNAIEAMRDTGGELTIRSCANPEGRLIVSISDTGIGLPAESTEQIFDPFHTTKPQGTGMGLTITRSIVESYGGRVWATANQVAGATFHLILPGETETHL
ncbi:PAS domain S-box-containing protein [Edaphobacter aggregans]|uniref:histidine kinase n=1 Tax=Edaphobacter aggregans TaxID=570835 RepID=A0A3R9QDX6_9BACT|nr:PAS domain-containing sensor histidine kinase [Edaphobacter aggregans]RSL19014.1 PAS domain S-box-containing protein [Edaphobacter aggregans]